MHSMIMFPLSLCFPRGSAARRSVLREVKGEVVYKVIEHK
jgi:hypothetical protein